ncbi:MAG TPA: DUF4446 family protein [Candidatus Paceibacterota bacterium]
MALFKKQEKPQELTPKNIGKKVQALEARLEEVTKELQALEKKSKQAISAVGVTRFNPFGEIGGNQSFCVVLLDEKRNGVVITSYYGRDLNRVYAKPIQAGKSEYELSEEEKEAIAQAIGQTI